MAKSGYTIASARVFLSSVNIRLKWSGEWQEFIVTDMRLDNNRRKQEAGSYHTDDIDDAVLTGLAMARAWR
jgi:hypothetical protein